ncbi:aminoacyl-tRNA hydrolase [Candidatus Peregrinibacteria bacterium]|nr:aminoacyl-tRNA hydrolase [Candidatus Peregrinibacteria bacterium]
MILIVGLGNPGPKYTKTRHNVGFLALDTLAYKLKTEFEYDKKYNAEIAEVKQSDLTNQAIILAKPHTFMNESGQAVQKIAHFFKIKPENIWVVFDELDLSLGTIKIRKNGSAGTHNGMKSVVSVIGKDFPRFRIGIESRGETASHLQDTASFVLSDFFGQEKEIIVKSIDKCVSAIETALKEGIEASMNKFN